MGKITNLYAEPLYRISDSREAIDFFSLWSGHVCSYCLDFPIMPSVLAGI